MLPRFRRRITRRRAREDRQLILKRLRAVLLRSFWGQHGEKVVCARGMPRVAGTLGKANSQFTPTLKGVGDRTITLRRLLIGAASLAFAATDTVFCRSSTVYRHAPISQNRLGDTTTENEANVNDIDFWLPLR